MKVKDIILALQECDEDTIVCAEDTYGIFEVDEAIFAEDQNYDDKFGQPKRGKIIVFRA